MDVATLADQLEELRVQTQQLAAAHQAEVEARKAEVAARLEAEAKCERYRKLYLDGLEKCKMLENGIIAGQKTERLSVTVVLLVSFARNATCLSNANVNPLPGSAHGTASTRGPRFGQLTRRSS